MVKGTVTIHGKIDAEHIRACAHAPARVDLAGAPGKTTVLWFHAGTAEEMRRSLIHMLIGLVLAKGMRSHFEKEWGFSLSYLGAHNEPGWDRVLASLFAHGATAKLWGEW